MNIEQISSLAAIAGVCIAAVNIIVEVLKSFWLRAETSRPGAVVAVAEAVAFFVVYAYCVLSGAKFTLMLGLGAFAGGFFIAYGAMFGYDKLYGTFFESLKKAGEGKRGERD